METTSSCINRAIKGLEYRLEIVRTDKGCDVIYNLTEGIADALFALKAAQHFAVTEEHRDSIDKNLDKNITKLLERLEAGLTPMARLLAYAMQSPEHWRESYDEYIQLANAANTKQACKE